MSTITIDFLYLDLNVCDRCQATGATLDEAVLVLSRVFTVLGQAVAINRVNITTPELAEQYRFVSSPTIRVNGVDICTDTVESACTACSGLSGTTTDCRVFVYDGQEYDQPPTAAIIDGILRALYAGDAAPGPREESYTLPDNLVRFFSGVANTCCTGNCDCSSSYS